VRRGHIGKAGTGLVVKAALSFAAFTLNFLAYVLDGLKRIANLCHHSGTPF
jgi:hypothetical protein